MKERQRRTNETNGRRRSERGRGQKDKLIMDDVWSKRTRGGGAEREGGRGREMSADKGEWRR